jgi:hypothetical protein
VGAQSSNKERGRGTCWKNHGEILLHREPPKKLHVRAEKTIQSPRQKATGGAGEREGREVDRREDVSENVGQRMRKRKGKLVFATDF